MIKDSCYIRKISKKHKELLHQMEEQTGLKKTPDLLFKALESWEENHQDIERLKRLLEYKQKKIDRLEQEREEILRIKQLIQETKTQLSLLEEKL